ncbi:MAG: hypothetical protein LBI57_03455 [Helicobacteraceae bacterium]|jgi:hypothetical protein|nr:hypothetical protein [Helicobacteraceae bacterium]
MRKTYIIKGGLGKSIAFSALVQKLAEKEGEKINVISAYPDIFAWSPYIDRSWSAAQFDQNPELQAAGKLIAAEPYDCEYKYDPDQHICAWWANEFDVNFDPNADLPRIALGGKALEISETIRARIAGRSFGVVQFSGGQSPEGYNPDAHYPLTPMTLSRNYPPQIANVLMRRLRAAYPRTEWINFALSNEPDILAASKINAPYIAALELAKNAAIIVCIDGALAHFAAAAGRSAVVLWNSFAWANPNKYGWHIHKNLVAPNMEHDYADAIDAVKTLYTEANQ